MRKPSFVQKTNSKATRSAGSSACLPSENEPKAKRIRLTPPRRAKLKPEAALIPEHFAEADTQEVHLELFAPTAGEVLLAGTFNDWQPLSTPLSRQGEERWSVDLKLKPGKYEYRFVVDGQWADDPLAPAFVANPFGGLNCVLQVPSAA